MLRPGLVYGPGDPHLVKLATAIYFEKFVFIGSRQNIVPLVHVADMCEAMAAAARVKGGSRLYHITDGSRTTIGQLVSELARVMSCAEPKRVLPRLVPRLANTVCGMLERPGPVSQAALRFLGSSRHIDITRACTELNFSPRVQLAEGIESMRATLGAVRVSVSAA
jgi:nucleoside-diphosphate-sugar epimerase